MVGQFLDMYLVHLVCLYLCRYGRFCLCGLWVVHVRCYMLQCSTHIIRIVEKLGKSNDVATLAKSKDRIVIRIPLIPQYNTPEDQKRSQQALEELEFVNFDVFEYIVRA